jgi:multiple sugar transport system ATP-binding protein
MGQIKLKQVSKSFDAVKVIHPLDLTIENGEFIVFVGPSGCGKSTLLRLIAGLEDVTEGAIEIDGKDVTYLPPAERGLAMVFQSYALYPHMSVRKNIAFPLKMAGLDKAEQERRVNEAARVLNLGDYLDRRPSQLSGGQRQRVAIGRADGHALQHHRRDGGLHDGEEENERDRQRHQDQRAGEGTDQCIHDEEGRGEQPELCFRHRNRLLQ